MNMKLSNMERISVSGQTDIVHIALRAQETPGPLRLHMDGNGDDSADMVVMSLAAYQDFMRDIIIWSKLREAEFEEAYDGATYTHEEVFASLRGSVGGDFVA